MRVSGMVGTDLHRVPEAVASLERRGYDVAFSAEINGDPFFPLLLAAEHSERIALTTSISVAFARSPMTTAYLAWDLNQYSGGRFNIGLGSQIKPHITRRFSMPWSRPASRMREYIRALRSIWHCWETGDALDFRGEFYRHDLMTPMFTPSNREFGAPGIHLAAVGPRMTEVAAEEADGMIAHGFTTDRYLREVTLPAIERGLNRSGRRREDFDLCCPVMVVTGDTREAFDRSREAVVQQLGFYASTPAYRAVLELHGWGELQDEAHRLTREGRWQALGGLISDDILAAFAIVTERPEDLPGQLAARFGGTVDTWICTAATGDDAAQRRLVTAVQGL